MRSWMSTHRSTQSSAHDFKWAVVLSIACAFGLFGAGLKDARDLAFPSSHLGPNLTPGQIQLVSLQRLIDPEWAVLGWFTRDDWDEVILVVSSSPHDGDSYTSTWDSVLMIIDRPLTDGYLISQATEEMRMPTRNAGSDGWKLWRADSRVSMRMVNRSKTIAQGRISRVSPHTSTFSDFPGSVTANATPVAIHTDR